MGTDDSVEIDKLRETIEKLKESLSQSETIDQYEELPTTPFKIESPVKDPTSQPAPIVAPKAKDTVQEQPQNEMTEVDKQRVVIQDYDSKIQELQNSLPNLSQQIKQLREGQTKAPSYYSEYQEKIDVLTKQLDSITENTVQLTREKNASQAKLDKILQFVNERDFIQKTDPALAQDFDKEIKSFKADISLKDNKPLSQIIPSSPTTESKTDFTKTESTPTEPKTDFPKTESTPTEPKTDFPKTESTSTESKFQISETENKKIEPQKIEQPKFILTSGEHGEAARQTNLITGETTTVPRAEAVFNKPTPTLAQAAISNQPPAPVKKDSSFETKETPKS